MRYCGSCGAPIEDGVQFCPKCGQAVTPNTNGTEQPNAGVFTENNYQQQPYYGDQSYGQQYGQDPRNQPYGSQQQYGYTGDSAYGQQATLSKLDTWFEETLSRICKGKTLQIAMIVCVVLNALGIIAGFVFGAINDVFYGYVDMFSSPLYIIPSVLSSLSCLFAFVHMFDCCYKRGIRQPLFGVYTIALLGGNIFMIFGCVVYLALIPAALLTLCGLVVGILYSIKLVNTEFGLLFKMNIGYIALQFMASIGYLISPTFFVTLSALSDIGMALFIYFQLKPVYEAWSMNDGYNALS